MYDSLLKHFLVTIFCYYKVLTCYSTYPLQPRICFACEGNEIHKITYLCLISGQIFSFKRECLGILPYDRDDCRIVDKGDFILEVCFCSKYFCNSCEDSAWKLSSNLPLVVISIFAMLFTEKNMQSKLFI